MSEFQARIYVTPRPSVRNPEGTTIYNGLRQLGYENVDSVLSGRYFEVNLEADGLEEAQATVDRMCRELLANPVIEQFRFDLAARQDQP